MATRPVRPGPQPKLGEANDEAFGGAFLPAKYDIDAVRVRHRCPETLENRQVVVNPIPTDANGVQGGSPLQVLAAVHRRPGELYEERGHRNRAIEQYNAFVELWKDADAELQPQVQDVRRRLAGLVGEASRRR